MTYIFATILGVIMSLAAAVWGLITENRSLKEKAANTAAQGKTKEWNDEIKTLEGKITDEDRDYENAKKRFDSGNPPSGAV